IRGVVSARGDLAGLDHVCAYVFGIHTPDVKGSVSIRGSVAADRAGQIAVAAQLATNDATIRGSVAVDRAGQIAVAAQLAKTDATTPSRRRRGGQMLVPMVLDARAGIPATRDRINVETLRVTSRYAMLQAAGQFNAVASGFTTD